MFSVAESFVAATICTCVLVLACGCGISVWLTGWRGKQAGIILGAGVIVSGLAVLFLISQTIPRYWWISLLPIYVGIQCIRIWSRSEPARGFRLSSLLLTIGMLGTLLGGVGRLYRQRILEEPAAAKIESFDGVYVHSDFDGFATTVGLEGASQDAINESLLLLRHLRHLRRLQLNHRNFTLEQAKQIGRLTGVRDLGLQSTNFDDEKMAELQQLHELETIDLIGTAVTAKGLDYLRNAKSLQTIWTDNDAISEAEKEKLRAVLPKLDIH